MVETSGLHHGLRRNTRTTDPSALGIGARAAVRRTRALNSQHRMVPRASVLASFSLMRECTPSMIPLGGNSAIII